MLPPAYIVLTRLDASAERTDLTTQHTTSTDDPKLSRLTPSSSTLTLGEGLSAVSSSSDGEACSCQFMV